MRCLCENEPVYTWPPQLWSNDTLSCYVHVTWRSVFSSSYILCIHNVTVSLVHCRGMLYVQTAIIIKNQDKNQMVRCCKIVRLNSKETVHSLTFSAERVYSIIESMQLRVCKKFLSALHSRCRCVWSNVPLLTKNVIHIPTCV